MTSRPLLGPGRRGIALLACALVLSAALLQGSMEARAGSTEKANPMLYLPSGKYLKFAALGFDAILADLIYLWSIQYYGDYAIEDRYDYLEHIYGRVISELDPRYLDPYLVGALIMTVEAREPEMGLRLLDKGIARNPGQWILAFEAGFICYNDLHDYSRAAGYFEEALRAPDVHPLVRRFYAEMHNRSGDKRASLREWAEIHDTTDDEYVRNVAWKHVHDLKVAVDLEDLRGGLQRFRESHGRWPRRLAELAKSGTLGTVPTDPGGQPYHYERSTGQVDHTGDLVLNR
jgi:tetratricopeptide (TPR) repeat protein